MRVEDYMDRRLLEIRARRGEVRGVLDCTGLLEDLDSDFYDLRQDVRTMPVFGKRRF